MQGLPSNSVECKMAFEYLVIPEFVWKTKSQTVTDAKKDANDDDFERENDERHENDDSKNSSQMSKLWFLNPSFI